MSQQLFDSRSPFTLRQSPNATEVFQVVERGHSLVKARRFEQRSRSQTNFIGLRSSIKAQRLSLSGGWLQQSQQEANRRCLTCSIRTEKAKDYSGGDFDGQVIYGSHRRKIAGQIFSANSYIGHSPTPFSTHHVASLKRLR